MDLIGMAERFSVDRLHQKQLEIVRCAQILGDTCLTDGFFPEHRAGLPAQPIPALLVIVHDGPKKIPFEFLKGHGSRLGRCLSIMNAMTRVGETPLKALSHPAKERFDGSFGPSRQLHRVHL